MDKHIFYSWQSDLPNSKNRGFIQDCIEMAVAQIQRERIYLEVAIDRDTKGTAGTPDIVSTIFSKIERTNIFIADVSIINPNDDGRKTPNPNVLVELGYAAKCIGWNNIICVFNTEFAKVEDLPFDLRFRRPLLYQIENPKTKTQDKKRLTEQIKEALKGIINKQSAGDEIKSYIKQNIDKAALSICNHLFKIINGYDEQLSSENVWPLLNLSQKEVQEQLFEKRYLGFTVLKEWEGTLDDLQDRINQPFFLQHAEQSIVNAVLKIIKALELIVSISNKNKIFEDTGIEAEGYKVIPGRKINPDNPKDRYVLLKEIKGEKGIVTDFGDIKPFNAGRALNYQYIRSDKFMSYALALHMLLASVNNWIKTSGNSFLIGPSYVG